MIRSTEKRGFNQWFKRRKTQANQRQRRQQFESLEDRRVLATNLNPGFEALPDLDSYTVVEGPDGLTESVTVIRNVSGTEQVAFGRLSVSGNVDASGTGTGPTLRSATFDAVNNEIISLDWRATETTDDPVVSGFMYDANNHELVGTFFDVILSVSTAFESASVTVPYDGSFYMEFTVGSFDATGGQAIGATLDIDNIETTHAVISAGFDPAAGDQRDDGTPDRFMIVNVPASGEYQIYVNSSLIQSLGSDTIHSIVINGSSDDDLLEILNAGDLITVPITFNGGLGHDRLEMREGSVTASEYSAGPDVAEGTIVQVAGADVQTVRFTGLESVSDQVSADNLSVNGTNADNAINLNSTGGLGHISVDNFTRLTFSNKENVQLNGLAGSDDFNLNDRTIPQGLTGNITIFGGDEGGEDDHVIVNGTNSNDTLSVELALDPNSAEILRSNQGRVTVTETELLSIDGQAGNDELEVDGTFWSDTFVHKPGSYADSGRLETTRILFGASHGISLMPIEYSRLGDFGELKLTGDALDDRLILEGTEARDSFVVPTFSPDGDDLSAIVSMATELSPRIPIHLEEILNVTIQALGDSDEVTIVLEPGGDGEYIDVTVDGGSDDFDRVVIRDTVAGEDVEADLQFLPGVSRQEGMVRGFDSNIDFLGTEEIYFIGQQNNDTVQLDLGSGRATARLQSSIGQDPLSVLPATSLDLFQSDVLPSIFFGDLSGRLENVQVLGSQGPTELTVALTELVSAAAYQYAAINRESLIIEGSDSEGDQLTVFTSVGEVGIRDDLRDTTLTTVNGPLVGLLRLNTLGGDDSVTIDVDNTDLVRIPIHYDGGDGHDDLLLTGTSTTNLLNTVYQPGAEVGDGRLTYATGGFQFMQVDFESLEPVVDLITASSLLVNGTHTDNAITYTPGENPSHGLVTVDEFETIEFANKGFLEIDARHGADTIIINNELLPTGLNRITARGSEGDDVIVLTGISDAELTTFSSVSIFGDAGDDILDARDIDVTTSLALLGGFGDDTLIGGVGSDALIGGPGDDTMDGGPGDNSFIGSSFGTAVEDFDTVLVTGTKRDDDLVVNQTEDDTLVVTFNGDVGTNQIIDVDAIRVSGDEGDDTIEVNIEETLTASVRITVDGGPNNGQDLLRFVDDGPGDGILLRQGPDDQSGTIYPDELGPVVYERISYLRFTPLNTVTGGTGDDGAGRIVVLDQDPFEFNGTLPNSSDLEALDSVPHNPTIDVAGDEDWYRYRAPKIGTFSFEILFDRISTLPGNGELIGSVYRQDGSVIADSIDFADGDVVSFSADRLEDYYLRVRGDSDEDAVINVYDVNLVEVDLLGPQLYDPDGAGPEQPIQLPDVPDFNLFGLKGSDGLPQGPTPAVNRISINLQDLLNRVDHLPDDLLNRPVPNGRAPGDLYAALDELAVNAGLFEIRGDHNGIISIESVEVVQSVPVAGQIPTAVVTLVFAEPLPDDRYTLTISDGLIDPPGNAFDGESNADEPNGGPEFPSGNDVSGGDFEARFSVDSRAELGVWADGSVWTDTNGNFQFDPENKDNDIINSDIVYTLGFTTDNIFAGNFGTDEADGYDKLGAYGRVAGAYRWLIDTDNDGVPNLVVGEPTQVNGLPIAGNFDGDSTNGDEVAIKNGDQWLLDTNHDFMTDVILNGNMIGYPIVGDFDGDGSDDLGAWRDDTFFFDLSSNGIDGNRDVKFTFGFSGARERPVAADFNGDGVDDLGLWVPDRTGVTAEEAAEWYLLLSGEETTVIDRIEPNFDGTGGKIVDFVPVPFGNDIYARFGDNFALPVVGNFDPPVNPDPVEYGTFMNQNPGDPLDVNGDGARSPVDALWIVNKLNDEGSQPTETFRVEVDALQVGVGPFYDVSGDRLISPVDALMVINALNDDDILEAEGEAARQDAVSFLRLTARLTASLTAPLTASLTAPLTARGTDAQRNSDASRDDASRSSELEYQTTEEKPALALDDSDASRRPVAHDHHLDQDLLEILSEDVAQAWNEDTESPFSNSSS